MTSITEHDYARCLSYSTAPAVSPFDYDIRYMTGCPIFPYALYCGTTWVASALTNGDADTVADEMIYRAFLAQPDVIGAIPIEPPPDDAPDQDGDIEGIPQGVEWHLRECPVCASLPHCASCDDPILDTGMRVCPVCRDAGYCPVCGKEHHAWQCGGVLWLEETMLEPPYAALAA